MKGMPHVTKSKPARAQENVSRETKECGCENERNRGTRQNQAAGEGLELVCGKKGSQSETKETAVQNNYWNGQLKQKWTSQSTNGLW